MLLYNLCSGAVLATGSRVAMQWISNYVDGWEKMELKSFLKVWPAELGIAAINSSAGVIFGFQVAKIAPGFFVTYQIAFGFVYILALPVIAGMQIAVRDASAEQSRSSSEAILPLHHSKWWPQFLYASLIPTCVMMAITGLYPRAVFKVIYNYSVPMSM
jgi:hypothetical protein